MADVTAPASRGDRAQVILVGGIVVALSLVALVVLLNTVLFAENVATRGVDPAIDRAQDHAAVARDAGAAILRGENAPAAGHETWNAVDEAIGRDVARTSTVTRNRSFRRFGGYSDISVVATRQGAALVQNETRTFTDADDESDFPLATTGGIRRFTTTVDAQGTASASGTDKFTVRITGDDGSSWWARVNASDDPTVHVTTSTGTTCTATQRNATVDWTAGRIGDCTFRFALDSAGDPLAAPYDLRFENGANASGTYRLVVRNGSSDAVETDTFNRTASTDSPRQYPAGYSLRLRAVYEEGETSYATTVRVAPDEPTQTSPAA